MTAQPYIPGYELTQYLGGGPLTQVFAARECSSGSSCVVKTLRKSWEDESTAIKLLQREARAGLMVWHPHLVRTIHAHVTRPPYFLILELLTGWSLHEMLRIEGPLDVPSASTILRQISQALQALHRAGFIHGDIKPENIWLVNDATAKLIDLGFTHRPGENVPLLADGYLLGTANYLAPECCHACSAVDLRSDLYSLGITFYEMLTGRLPYPAGSVRETLRRHCDEPPMDPREYASDLPEPLVAILTALMARSSDERLPNASALVQRLVSVEAALSNRRMSA